MFRVLLMTALMWQQERPQLESERTQLLESIANDQQVVLDLENKTLSLLQKSEGS